MGLGERGDLGDTCDVGGVEVVVAEVLVEIECDDISRLEQWSQIKHATADIVVSELNNVATTITTTTVSEWYRKEVSV